MPSSTTFSIPYAVFSTPVGTLPVFVVPTPTGDLIVCNGTSFNQAHFLDLFDRLYPLEFISPLKRNVNAGYEIMQSAARVGERVSTAIENLECGAFVIFSAGGQRARVPVAFQRDSIAAGAVTVKAGTRVVASGSGRRFLLIEDVVFGAGDLGPLTGICEAEAVGYEYNVTGQVVTDSGIILPGDIDAVEFFVQDPPYGDPSIVVYQSAFPTQLGRSADLDGLAQNRGLTRQATPARTESDNALRLRIRSLPDVVSYDAIQRAIARVLAPLGLPYDLIEVFEHRYQECYDAPSPNAGTPSWRAIPPANPAFNNTTFVYDDPRSPDPWRNRYLDDVEYRGCFFVVVRNDITLFDIGLAYDDPGMFATDFRNPATGQQRGTPAFDGTLSDNPSLVYNAAYDGFDTARAAAYAALFQDLQNIKPVGVVAAIVTFTS